MPRFPNYLLAARIVPTCFYTDLTSSADVLLWEEEGRVGTTKEGGVLEPQTWRRIAPPIGTRGKRRAVFRGFGVRVSVEVPFCQLPCVTY